MAAYGRFCRYESNINSCCFTRNRNNEHIQIWMKVRHLLDMEFNYDIENDDQAQNASDQHLLETNKQQFINAFGDTNAILSCFIKNSNTQQLTNIYNVLKTIKLNASQTLSKTVETKNNDDNDIIILDKSDKQDIYTMEQALDMEATWNKIDPHWKQQWPIVRCQRILNTPHIRSSFSIISYAKMYLKYWKSIQFHSRIHQNYRGFSQLSSVEIVNICGFLQRADIIRFKASNFKIGLICLQEMMKLSVAVYNMNKIIHHENKDLFKLNDAKYMTFHRYAPMIKMSNMYEQWERYYNIPMTRQLICEYDPFNYTYNIITAKDVSNYNAHIDRSLANIIKSEVVFDSACNWDGTRFNNQINSIKLRGPFLLFDTTNITILTPNIIANMYNYNEKIKQKHNNNNTKPNVIYPTTPTIIYPPPDGSFPEPATEYSLLTIKYFDIMDQRLDVVNFICINYDVTFVRLFDYIENHFNIQYTLNPNNLHSNSWYHKFKQQLLELNAFGGVAEKYDGFVEESKNNNLPTHNKIIANEKIEKSVLDVLQSEHGCLKQVFVFQFNPRHPYFVRKINEKENESLGKIYKFCKSFISDYDKIQITFYLSSDQLKNQQYLRKVYTKTHANDNSNPYAVHQFLTNSEKEYRFGVGSLWDFGLLRKKLASKLNCSPQFIEIYSVGSGKDPSEDFRIGDDVIYQSHNAKIFRISGHTATITYKTSNSFTGLSIWSRQRQITTTKHVSFNDLQLKTTRKTSQEPMQRKSWNQTIDAFRNFKWRLVGYNTKLYDANTANECIYQLKLILSDEGADALQRYTKTVDYPIFIKYKRTFKINELINFVTAQICEYHGHNDELKSIVENMNVNNSILTSFSRCYASNQSFRNDTPGIVTNLNIFIVENDNINKIDNKQKFILHIRFIDGKGGFGTVSGKTTYYNAVNQLVGIPYAVSFNKNDNLQTIINKSTFNQWLKDNISCCYRFNGAQSTIVNVPRKAKSYQHIFTYNEIMFSNVNECLIIKLKKPLYPYRTPKKKSVSVMGSISLPMITEPKQPPKFNVRDIVIFEGQHAEIMKIIGLNAVEITYPINLKNISQRTKATVFRRQLKIISDANERSRIRLSAMKNTNNNNNNTNNKNNKNDTNFIDLSDDDGEIYFKLNAPSSNAGQYFKIKMKKQQLFGTIIGPLEIRFKKKIGLYFKGSPILPQTTPQNLVVKFGAKNDDFIDVFYK